MAALTRPCNAPHNLLSKLLMQVLFLVLLKPLLLQTTREDHGVIDLYLGKDLATIRAQNCNFKHQPQQSRSDGGLCLPLKTKGG